jgi:hypothetical protein
MVCRISTYFLTVSVSLTNETSTCVDLRHTIDVLYSLPCETNIKLNRYIIHTMNKNIQKISRGVILHQTTSILGLTP